MLWIKSLHIISMVTWFAGLFYLPRLFVYHAQAEDAISLARFKLMERKLFWGITTPGGVLTVGSGGWLLISQWSFYIEQPWLQLKLAIVALLILYHVWCGKLLIKFKQDLNQHSHVWYRYFNEIPTIGLIVVVILAVVKPTI